MTDESRWIEFMVSQDDLMVLELAVRRVDSIEHYEMLNDEAKFEYAGNIRELKSAINRVCQPDSETADDLRERIDRIVKEQDEARGEAV